MKHGSRVGCQCLWIRGGKNENWCKPYNSTTVFRMFRWTWCHSGLAISLHKHEGINLESTCDQVGRLVWFGEGEGDIYACLVTVGGLKPSLGFRFVMIRWTELRLQWTRSGSIEGIRNWKIDMGDVVKQSTFKFKLSYKSQYHDYITSIWYIYIYVYTWIPFAFYIANSTYMIAQTERKDSFQLLLQVWWNMDQKTIAYNSHI